MPIFNHFDPKPSNFIWFNLVQKKIINSFYKHTLSICYITVAVENTKINETKMLLVYKEIIAYKDLLVYTW